MSPWWILKCGKKMGCGLVLIVNTHQRTIQMFMNTLRGSMLLDLATFVLSAVKFVQPEKLWDVTSTETTQISSFLKFKHFILVTGHEEMINSKMWKGEGQWACTDCDYTSKKKDHVYEHIEAKHVQGPGYMCQQCDKVCPTRKALRHHLGRYHPKY